MSIGLLPAVICSHNFPHQLHTQQILHALHPNVLGYLASQPITWIEVSWRCCIWQSEVAIHTLSQSIGPTVVLYPLYVPHSQSVWECVLLRPGDPPLVCFSFRLQQDVWSHISIVPRLPRYQVTSTAGLWPHSGCTPTLSYPITVNKPQITGLIECRVSVSACGYVVPTLQSNLCLCILCSFLRL